MRARVSVREGERAAGGVPGRARGRGSIAVASRDDFRKNKFSSFEKKNGNFFAAKKVHTPLPAPARRRPVVAHFCRFLSAGRVQNDAQARVLGAERTTGAQAVLNHPGKPSRRAGEWNSGGIPVEFGWIFFRTAYCQFCLYPDEIQNPTQMLPPLKPPPEQP